MIIRNVFVYPAMRFPVLFQGDLMKLRMPLVRRDVLPVATSVILLLVAHPPACCWLSDLAGTGEPSSPSVLSAAVIELCSPTEQNIDFLRSWLCTLGKPFVASFLTLRSANT